MSQEPLLNIGLLVRAGEKKVRSMQFETTHFTGAPTFKLKLSEFNSGRNEIEDVAVLYGDLNQKVEFATASGEELPAYKIGFDSGKSTTDTLEICAGRLPVRIQMDVTAMCFERMLDYLKLSLEPTAVLYCQSTGFSANPLYARLGFTVKPIVFADSVVYRPRTNVFVCKLAMSDWKYDGRLTP